MKKLEAARVASPYGHGIDRVLRSIDTLAVMMRRGQLREAQYHAGQRYRHCYEVIYGQMGGASDFERTRGKGLPGSPPPQSYLEASEIVSQVKRILYPRDYAVVHRVCVDGLSLGECAEQLYGGDDRSNREQAGDRLREGLRELAERWFGAERKPRIRAFVGERATVTDSETVEPGKVHHAGT
jgi:hypothetical protein